MFLSLLSRELFYLKGGTSLRRVEKIVGFFVNYMLTTCLFRRGGLIIDLIERGQQRLILIL